VKHLEDLEFDKIIGKSSPLVDEGTTRQINEEDLNQQLVG